MKHASARSLDQLDDLLNSLRSFSTLKERSRGVFYLKSKAFLHFHEDPKGLFADARLKDDDFERFPVNTARERQALLREVREMLHSR
jgi:hypothetical protein